MTPTGELPLPPLVGAPYLLVTNIPITIAPSGVVYLDRLWHKDLLEHLRYLRHLVVACPSLAGEPPPDSVPVDPAVRFLRLPPPRGLLRSLLDAPATLGRLWGAVGRAAIVHSGIAGWPYPLGWPANLFAWIRRRPTIIIVESAPWRPGPGMTASRKDRVREWIYERMAAWCLRRCDLPLFTHEQYRSSMLRTADRGVVIHASWIDQDVILDDPGATASWKAKAGSPFRVLFAGRVTAAKGVEVLLKAIRLLHGEKAPIQVDILGQGDLTGDCERLAAELSAPTRIRLRGVVPYGPEFFALLREYHALVVPSLTDEQPRIVYDAYSQAVPVLASNTPGLRDCVRDGVTGALVPSGDPAALAGVLRTWMGGMARLESLGRAARDQAGTLTHRLMHERRWRMIDERLPARG